MGGKNCFLRTNSGCYMHNLCQHTAMPKTLDCARFFGRLRSTLGIFGWGIAFEVAEDSGDLLKCTEIVHRTAWTPCFRMRLPRTQPWRRECNYGNFRNSRHRCESARPALGTQAPANVRKWINGVISKFRTIASPATRSLVRNFAVTPFMHAARASRSF